MSLEVTELFSGTKTKRLVISYKEGSDFDLVLQQLQKNRRAGKKTYQGLSHLIRTLVIATNGFEVFKHHPDVDSTQYERFCLEALGVISGYCSVVKGYLSLLGARGFSDENDDLIAPATNSNLSEEREDTNRQSRYRDDSIVPDEKTSEVFSILKNGF